MALYRFEIENEDYRVGFFENLPNDLDCLRYFNRHLDIPHLFLSYNITPLSFESICYFNTDGFRFFSEQIKQLIHYHLDNGRIVKMKVVPFNPRKERKGLVYEDDFQLMLIERLAKKPNKVIRIENKSDLNNIIYFS